MITSTEVALESCKDAGSSPHNANSRYMLVGARTIPKFLQEKIDWHAIAGGGLMAVGALIIACASE
jgi:hypothetical protein